MTEPFVLLHRVTLPAEAPPGANDFYDPKLQIWIDIRSGLPLVQTLSRSASTKFGETTLTESREGVDQSAVFSITASTFGETTMTKSQEGVDQTGEAPLSSQFGETSHTATREGADTSEGTASIHASYPEL